MLLRICITCNRYDQNQPTPGERLADAAAAVLAARPQIDCAILRVACLNGCKGPCQALLTGRQPLRIGGLAVEDAEFLVDLAAVYAAGGDASSMIPPAANRPGWRSEERTVIVESIGLTPI